MSGRRMADPFRHARFASLLIAVQQPAGSLHVDTRAPGDTMTVFHPPRDITAIERVFRWFFSVPQWVQLSGAIVAIALGIIALVVVWRERQALIQFARERHLTTPTVWKVVIGIAALGVLIGLGGSGVGFMAYSQNNNQFCISCHTLHDEIYQRFQQSKHHRIALLRCHDCHDEPIVAEIRQVGLWMIKRPSDVGPHAPVPREVCANCHVRRDADSTWKRIVATAGHRIHVTSDTAKALKIECLTCHGVTAHRFVPVGQTCAKSGCHEQTPFKLGRMANQSSQHCTACHNFTAPTGDQASLDSAKRALVPTNENCLTCHAMQNRLAAYIPANDPHRGRCGDCHDPHKQPEPKAAWSTCSTSGCHVRPDTLTPFHRGIAQTALADCGSCHKAHDWKVKGESCLGCHRTVFDDRRVSSRAAAVTPASVAQAPAAGQGTGLPALRHSQHRGVECTSCHTSTGAKHGALTLRTRTDCLTCHHGPEPKPNAGPMACTACHASAELASVPRTQPITMRLTTGTPPRTRPFPFTHARHASVDCVACHAAPVTRAVVNDCTSCHQDHHAATRACVTCHTGAQSLHKRSEVHQGCTGSGCHQDVSVLALAPTRNVCLTCHNDKVNHKEGGNCGTCHQVRWAPTAARIGEAR